MLSSLSPRGAVWVHPLHTRSVSVFQKCNLNLPNMRSCYFHVLGDEVSVAVNSTALPMSKDSIANLLPVIDTSDQGRPG